MIPARDSAVLLPSENGENIPVPNAPRVAAQRRRWLPWVTLAAVPLSLFLFSWEARVADAAHRSALLFLRPVFALFQRWNYESKWVATEATYRWLAGIALVTSIAWAAWCVVKRGKFLHKAPESLRGVALFVSIAAISLGYLGQTAWSLSLWGLALLAIVTEHRWPARSWGPSFRTDRTPWQWQHSSVAFGVLALALAVRFFGINDAMPGWTPEPIFGMTMSQTISSGVRAGLNMVAPAGSYGWLNLLCHYFAYKLGGISFVTQRTLYASTSIATCVAIFLTGRLLAGTRAGAVAAVLFLLLPAHTAWARSEFYFPIAELGTVVLVYTTLLAFRRRRLVDLVAMAVVTAGSVFLYPGVGANPAIPCVALLAAWLFVPGGAQRWRRESIAVACGVVGWVAGRRLLAGIVLGYWQPQWSPLQTSPLWYVFSSRSFGEAIVHLRDAFEFALPNFYYLLQAVFIGGVGSSHISYVGSAAPATTVSALVAVVVPMTLCALLLMRKHLVAAIFVGWLVSSVFPLALTGGQDPRLFIALYPALAVIAGLGYAGLYDYFRAAPAGRFVAPALALLGGVALIPLFVAQGRVWPVTFQQEKSKAFVDGLDPYIPGGTYLILPDASSLPTLYAIPPLGPRILADDPIAMSIRPVAGATSEFREGTDVFAPALYPIYTRFFEGTGVKFEDRFRVRSIVAVLPIGPEVEPARQFLRGISGSQVDRVRFCEPGGILCEMDVFRLPVSLATQGSLSGKPKN